MTTTVRLRTTMAIVGILAASVGLTKVVLTPAIATNRDGWRLPRLRQLLQQLPTIAVTPGRTVLVVGSSQAALGFVPRVFEAAMAQRGTELKAYNLAMNGATPVGTRMLAEYIAPAWQGVGRKADLVLIHFSPRLSTKSARKLPFRDQVVLLDRRTLRQQLQSDPVHALTVAVDRYFLSGAEFGISASDLHETLTTILFGADPARCFFAPFGWKKTAESSRHVAKLCDALANKFPSGRLGWQPEERGYAEMVFPETKESYAAALALLRTPDSVKLAAKFFAAGLGSEDLDIDPTCLSEFVNAVRTLQKISSNVQVFLAPESELMKHSPAGIDRLRKAIAHIEQSTGAHVLDLSHTAREADFLDGIHLDALNGAPALSTLLAERVASSL